MIDTNKEKYTIQDLLELMKFLRSDSGCPWDKEQTHQSIKKNAIEEAYEVVDAIDSNSPERLYDELGDLLLQVVFHSQMASEAGEFDFEKVADHISKKLISRHTHLFGEKTDIVNSSQEVLTLWEKNKKVEKNQKTQTQGMKEIPRVLPALERAYKIQKKAKQVGFDWDKRDDVIAKIKEEIEEVEEAVSLLENFESHDAKKTNLNLKKNFIIQDNTEISILNASDSFREERRDIFESESRDINEELFAGQENENEKARFSNLKNENQNRTHNFTEIDNSNRDDKESLKVKQIAKKENENESGNGKKSGNENAKDGRREMEIIKRKNNIETEIGDLLFSVVNYARFLEIDSEIALDKANQKFVKRFGFVENKVLSQNQKMENFSLDELDMIWNEAKLAEKEGRDF